jgi:hypothetical protein
LAYSGSTAPPRLRSSSTTSSRFEIGGGPADVANRWPEPYAGPDGAHTKDILENKLKAEICAGTIDLRSAQTCMAVDWIACARRYGIAA